MINYKASRLPSNGLAFCFLFLIFPISLFSQTQFQKDSLRFREQFNQIAQIFYQAKYDSAKNAFQAMAIEAETAGQLFWEARAYQGLGLALDGIGRYNEAMTYTFKALEYYEANQLEKYLGQAYDNIGALYFNLQQHDKSIEYHLKSVQIGEKREEWYSIAASYNNLAVVYESLDSIQLAKSMMFKVMEALKKSTDTTSYSILYNNLAGLYVDEKNYDSAEYYLQKSYQLVREKQQTGNLNLNYLVWGKIKYGREEYDSARYYFQQGLESALETQDLKSQKTYYLNFVKLYKATKDFQKALEYQKKYTQLSDSLATLKAAEQLNTLAIEYETQQKENQINEQQLEISRQKSRQIMLGGGTAFLILASIIGFLLFQNRQRKAQIALELEEAEAASLREMDRVKSHFFANISHEFRTPLTLILGPLKKLMSGSLEENPRLYFQLMKRNAERLLQLINQLLDLSKLEAGKMELRLEKGDIMAFSRSVAGNFISQANAKNTHFDIQIPDDPLITAFDADKLEKVVNNLLSNAFKFTPEEGEISLSISQRGQNLEISVKDSGIGIPEERLANIFERFFQVQSDPDKREVRNYEGSGIGLALVKEIIDLHEGEIQVESKPGEGSHFRVILPLIEQGDMMESVISTQTAIFGLEEIQPVLAPKPNPASNAPVILITEDNEDIRLYLKTLLQSEYQLIEAAHGREGCEKAQSRIPDLIISDVMMPEMDGFTFLKTIKNDSRTSHIPVIMLTARAGKQSKLQGLNIGADDYLAKPFDEEELLIKVRNLIEQRRKLSQKLGRDIVRLSPEEIEVESADKQFLSRVITVIETYMADENFTIEDLSQEVGLSRSQLHRKLKGLVDQSPSVFLRTIRLKRAKQMLEEKAGTSSEISFLVGFNSPAYFTRCFREQFGVTPGEIGSLG
ncbi:MAG: ATP-binding protein [Bacteroidia bacterium]